MRKAVFLLAVMAAALLMTGCSEPNATQQAAPEQEKKVVNEGMSKEEEEKLNKRLADLEDKVEQENTQRETTEPEVESAEDQVLEAAQDYYAAAAAGNYSYTYDALTSNSQSRFTEEEWVAANTALGSDAASYDIYSTELVDDTTATVGLTVTTTDGSGDDRNTFFLYENGDWKHELTQSEYELFAGATATASATASASASANGSPNPSPNPNPNRNAPRLNAPGNVSQSDGGGGRCPQGGYWVGKDGPGDGDSDGCAGE